MAVAAVCSVRTRLTPKASMTVTPVQYLGIQLSRTGRVTGQRALPIPVRPAFGSVAVSPDGSTMAVAVTGPAGRDPAIELFSTASGALLSWAADGRTLAFPLTTGHRSVQTRLLDTTAPGSSLRQASRVAVDFGHVPVQVAAAGTLGNSVIGVVTRSGFRPLTGSMAGVFQIAF